MSGCKDISARNNKSHVSILSPYMNMIKTHHATLTIQEGNACTVTTKQTQWAAMKAMFFYAERNLRRVLKI